MNPIDILGGILGGKKRGGMGGIGVEILKDIVAGSLGGGAASPPPRTSSPATPSSGGFSFPGRSSNTSRPSDDSEINVKDLEDMLGVGSSSPAQPQAPSRTSSSSNAPASTTDYRQGSPATNSNGSTGDIFGQDPTTSASQTNLSSDDAILLVRAMIFAAKADGRIDSDEQQHILDQVGNSSPETVKFLRDEFAKATDVRDFAWSVPLGMEQPVYAISLTAINLDSPKEVQFLKDLAHGLRIPPNICNQIHQRYGIRAI